MYKNCRMKFETKAQTLFQINDGICYYSTDATAKSYHITFEEVQQTCGKDVYPFCFPWAS